MNGLAGREATGRRRIVHAPAKINLNLLVGPKRADGFHPLDSLVVPLSLHDRIELTARDDGQVAFRCEGIDCGPDADNLAFRAARLLAEHPRAGGADIVLHKRIEPGKGLGGGSSDAAAVLGGLVDLWSLDLPPARLAELAAELGSDVPLFLEGGAVRMAGRGERVEPIDVHAGSVLLLVPDAFCSTGAVYAAFDDQADSPATGEGQVSVAVLEDSACAPGRGDWGRVEAGELACRQLDLARIAAEPPSSWRGELVNDLGFAARRVSPELAAAWDRLLADLDVPVHLTGSGSGLFVLCDTPDEARALLDRLPPCPGTLSAGVYELGGITPSGAGGGRGVR